MDAAAILSSPTPVTVNDDSATVETEAKAIVEETKTTEGQTEVQPKPEVKEDLPSSRLAFLAKEEKRIQEERRKAQEEKKSPEFSEFLEFKKMKENAKSDPLTVLEKLGLTYDEITDYVISGKGQKDPSIRTLEDKLAKMEQESKEKEEKAKKDLEEAQLNQFKSSIKEECLKDTEGCELINIWGAHNLVYNVIQAHYDSTQEVLPTSEAAKKVEAYLEQESQKYSGSKKLRKLFGAPDPSANDKQPSEKETATSTTTLSNDSSSGSSTTDDESYDTHTLLSKATKLISR